MTIQDQVIGALCIWRENRGGLPQPDAMQSVINVILNRAVKHNESVYLVCTTHAQFSSISMPGPESYLWPTETDPQWQTACSLAAEAAAGTLADITGGATLYYAPHGLTAAEIEGTFTLPGGTEIPWVKGWDQAAVTYTCTIAGQVFFTE